LRTYNRDAKTKLFTGISQKPTTIDKYLRALPILTAISEETKAMANLNTASARHHEDSTHYATMNAERVQQLKNVVEHQMVNPFVCESQDLLNISTGEKAQTTQLIEARELGCAALESAKERGSEKVSAVKLTTFATTMTKKVAPAAKANKVYETESQVLRSLYFVQNMTDAEKIEVFSHEWTNYPSSLFEPDHNLDQGFSMRKGNKADYLIAVRASVGNAWSETATLPSSVESTVLIVDAMAFIQRSQHMGSATFGELQQQYLKQLLSSRPQNCNLIHFIGDRYDVPPSESLKYEERERREKSGKGKSKEYQPHDALPVPEWKSFMQNQNNKANLLNFLGESWARHNFPGGCTLILGGVFKDPGRTLLVSQGSEATELPELSCRRHEEADSRMFAHMAYSVQVLGCKRAVVVANDTDVIMMCFYYSSQLPGLEQLWVQKMGVYVPVHAVVAALAEKYETEAAHLTSVLLSVYVMTGCDTVSFPWHRGKRRAFRAATENLEELTPLATYGQPGEDLHVSEDVIDAARHLFKSLYDRSSFGGSLDALRAHLFTNTKGDIRCLPPTEDAFRLHVLRSLQQMVVVKQAHLSEPVILASTDYGRQLVNGKLVASMMLKPPKPLHSNAKHCNCVKGRCLRGCPCSNAKVKCVIACRCEGDASKCARVKDTLDEF
jgi:hypothetical protein